MTLTQSIRLRLTVLLGLLGLLAIVVITDVMQARALQIAAKNRELYGQLQDIEVLTDSLQNSSDNYLANAARDYESYFRDVAVFFSDLSSAVETIDFQVKLADDSIASSLNSVVPFASGNDVNGLIIQSDSMAALWRDFHDGLYLALGEDEEEPRIEAGARYVTQHSEPLLLAVVTLEEAVEMFLEDQERAAQDLFTATLVSIVILGVLAIAWFYYFVARRVGVVSNACVRLASGEYGYTMNVTGQDEIAVLGRAFNLMSVRSEMTLSMVVNLQAARTPEEAIAAIARASGGYLPISWAAIISGGQTAQYPGVVATIPAQSRSQMTQLQVAPDTVFGQALSEAMSQGEPFNWNDLSNHSVATSDPFMSDVISVTDATGVLCVPLHNHFGWQGALLFVSRTGGFDVHQAELLQRLAPVIATNLQRLV